MEKSAGAVIFHKTHDSAIEYLLLHYPKLLSEKEKTRIGKRLPGHWDFPKGHVEQGETEIETASREVAEETGITQLRLVPSFREVIRYFFVKEEKKVFKEVVFYLAQSQTTHVILSEEHLGYTWLPFDEALETLTYKNAKGILTKAHGFLETHQGLF